MAGRPGLAVRSGCLLSGAADEIADTIMGEVGPLVAACTSASAGDRLASSPEKLACMLTAVDNSDVFASAARWFRLWAKAGPPRLAVQAAASSSMQWNVDLWGLVTPCRIGCKETPWRPCRICFERFNLPSAKTSVKASRSNSCTPRTFRAADRTPSRPQVVRNWRSNHPLQPKETLSRCFPDCDISSIGRFGPPGDENDDRHGCKSVSFRRRHCPGGGIPQPGLYRGHRPQHRLA